MPAIWRDDYKPPSDNPMHFVIEFQDLSYIRHDMDTGVMTLHASNELRLSAGNHVVVTAPRIDLN